MVLVLAADQLLHEDSEGITLWDLALLVNHWLTN